MSPVILVGPYVLGSLLTEVVGIFLFSLFPIGECCGQEVLSWCWVWHAFMLTIVVAQVSEHSEVVVVPGLVQEHV